MTKSFLSGGSVDDVVQGVFNFRVCSSNPLSTTISIKATEQHFPVVLFILLFKLVSQFNSADKRKLISCGLYLVFRNMTNSPYSHVLLELFLSSSSSLSLSPSMSSVRLNKELLQTTISSNAKTRGFSDNCSGCQIKGGNLVNVSILLSCNHVSPSVFQSKNKELKQRRQRPQ